MHYLDDMRFLSFFAPPFEPDSPFLLHYLLHSLFAFPLPFGTMHFVCLLLADGFLYLPAQVVIAVGIPPYKEVLFGEIVEQITHGDILQLLPLRDYSYVEFDDYEHDDYEHAETGIDDEGCNEEGVGGQEGIFCGVVVACVDGLYDGKQGSGSQDADCYLKYAPGRCRGDDCAHGVDEADVGGHYQGRRTYLLSPHLISRGGLAVEELDQSQEGQEEDGYADLDDGSQGGLEHRDVHDGIAVGVLE